MNNTRMLKTEKEFYISILTDKIRRIYNSLRIVPDFNFGDVGNVFEGDVEAYEKHKETIFRQLNMDEKQIMNYEIPYVINTKGQRIYEKKT